MSRTIKAQHVSFEGMTHLVWSWGSREFPRMKGTTVCAVHFRPEETGRTDAVPTCLECVGKR